MFVNLVLSRTLPKRLVYHQARAVASSVSEPRGLRFAGKQSFLHRGQLAYSDVYGVQGIHKYMYSVVCIDLF